MQMQMQIQMQIQIQVKVCTRKYNILVIRIGIKSSYNWIPGGPVGPWGPVGPCGV